MDFENISKSDKQNITKAEEEINPDYKKMLESAISYKRDGFDLKHKNATFNIVKRFFADKKATLDFDKLVKSHKKTTGGNQEMKRLLSIADWAIKKTLMLENNKLNRNGENDEKQILKELKERDFIEDAKKLQDDEDVALETGNYGLYELPPVDFQDKRNKI
jgi:hypothetical protein